MYGADEVLKAEGVLNPNIAIFGNGESLKGVIPSS